MMILEKIIQARKTVIDGGQVSKELALDLLDTPKEMVPYLASVANEIRHKFKGDRVELCALTNARSGNCSEDCAFCSQSAHHKTDAKTYPLIDPEQILEQAKVAQSQGADEFCIVTSGKGQTNEQDFENILAAIRLIREKTTLRVGTSLGFLTTSQVHALNEAGVFRNNHNLETSREHFPNIVSTHTFDQRIEHVKKLHTEGVNSCCGGIIGMGETPEQRIDLAFELRALDAECIPINILNPIEGSKLAERNLAPVPPMDIIKTIALFRIINPHCTLKIAGGRQVNLRELQATALLSGANGIILGNYLTTPGRDWHSDIQMIKDIGCTTSMG